MRTEDFLERLENVTKTSDGWSARCPAHDDQRNSLSIKDVDNIVCHCHAGCSFEDIMRAVDAKHPPHRSRQGSSMGEIIARYVYTDESGKPLYQVIRLSPKGFRQMKYEPSNPKNKDGYVWGVQGVRRVLYHLPKVAQAAKCGKVVFVVEGERDVASLERLGLVATCNAGGAGKWQEEYSDALAGAHVVILPDNDEAGRKHAQQVARSVLRVAQSVRIVALPGLNAKGDVSDWLEAGGKREQLEAHVKETSPWFPNTDAQKRQAKTKRKPKRDKEDTQLQKLLREATVCEFFEGEDGEAYVTYTSSSGSLNTSPVHSRQFEMWLRSAFFFAVQKEDTQERMSAAPNQESLKAALNTLEAKARNTPDMRGRVRVFLRSGGVYDTNGILETIYIDLANDAGEVVEIKPGTWKVIKRPPIRFLRTAAQLPLPHPDPQGKLDDALPLIRTETPGETVFVLGWLVFAFHPDGPYPALVLHGTAGSGKSSQTKLFRSLVDPVQSLVRRPPNSSTDLFVSAKQNRVIALENVSKISEGLSDDLCSIATGAGVGARTLYTNAEETSYKVCRPIIMNGIDEFITRGDLASRSLKVYVPKIKAENRQTEAILRVQEAKARPLILGGICHALAEALKHPEHRPERLPRMADFASFIDAIQNQFPASLPTLIEAMSDLQDSLSHEHVEASGVGSAIRAALSCNQSGKLEGDIKTWWENLDLHRAKGTSWPPNVQAFRSSLRRIKPALETLGILIEKVGQDSKTRRVIYQASWITGHDPSHPSYRSPHGKIPSSVIVNEEETPKDTRTNPGYELLFDPSPPKTPNGSQGTETEEVNDSKDVKDTVLSIEYPLEGPGGIDL